MGVDVVMLARTLAPVTPQSVRRWSYEVVERFGTNRMLVVRPGEIYREGFHALRIVDEFEVDEDAPIRPEPGETIISVGLCTRYYGRGYERGDLPTIIAVAEWCELRIPGASVWYGGDSGGAVQPFGPGARRLLFDHFVRHGHEPYHMYGNPDDAPLCDFCESAPLACSGGGQGQEFFVCHGCGWKVVRFSGKLYSVEDFRLISRGVK